MMRWILATIAATTMASGVAACAGVRPALMAFTPVGGNPRNADPTANPTETVTGGRYTESATAAGPVSTAPAVTASTTSAGLRCQGIGLAALAAAVLVGVSPLVGVSGTFEEAPSQPPRSAADPCRPRPAPPP